MFFFFAGGLQQQVRQVLKTEAGRCFICGSTADLVEYEKVLKLFFIPVWRWPGKAPLLHCNNCRLFFPQSASALPLPPSPSAVLDPLRCKACSSSVRGDFSFCLYCGASL